MRFVGFPVLALVALVGIAATYYPFNGDYGAKFSDDPKMTEMKELGLLGLIYSNGIPVNAIITNASITTLTNVQAAIIDRTNTTPVAVLADGSLKVSQGALSNTTDSVTVYQSNSERAVTNTVAPTLTQSRTYSTNIVLSSATTPVVLGTSQPFQWLTIVGNNLGRVANTNTIYIQTQADDGTNGIPVAPGGTVTLTLSPNKFDYLSNYWVGGVVGGAKLFWGY